MSRKRKAKILSACILVVILIFMQVKTFKTMAAFKDGNLEENNQKISHQLGAPEMVYQILRESCLDCHSEAPRIPWYGYIWPISEILHGDIQRGMNELNFSAFGQLDPRKKASRLGDVEEVLAEESMPLEEYLLLNPGAKIDAEELRLLQNWIDAEIDKAFDFESSGEDTNDNESVD